MVVHATCVGCAPLQRANAVRYVASHISRLGIERPDKGDIGYGNRGTVGQGCRLGKMAWRNGCIQRWLGSDGTDMGYHRLPDEVLIAFSGDMCFLK